MDDNMMTRSSATHALLLKKEMKLQEEQEITLILKNKVENLQWKVETLEKGKSSLEKEVEDLYKDHTMHHATMKELRNELALARQEINTLNGVIIKLSAVNKDVQQEEPNLRMRFLAQEIDKKITRSRRMTGIDDDNEYLSIAEKKIILRERYQNRHLEDEIASLTSSLSHILTVQQKELDECEAFEMAKKLQDVNDYEEDLDIFYKKLRNEVLK